MAQQRTEIQFWHAMGGVLGERVDEIVKRFNDSQTKYTVVATNKGNYDEVINATIAAYRAKKAPQIVQIYERGFMSMLLSGAIVPVQELMTEKKQQVDLADFIKPVASYYQYKGKLMSMPFNSSTPILFYNKEQFEKAGFERAGRYLWRVREAALRHQAARASPSAAPRWPATISGACWRTTAR